jgi:hypothetical protein
VPCAGLVDGHESEHLTSLGDILVGPVSDEAGARQLHIPGLLGVWADNGFGGCAGLLIVIGFGVEERYLVYWAEIVEDAELAQLTEIAEYAELAEQAELSQLSEIADAPIASVVP